MSYPRLALRALVGVLVLLPAAAVAVPAQAEDYPLPTHGQGKVDRTRVPVGECVIFSGDPGGFQPGATLTIKDDGVVVGTTTADAQGEFSHQVCFATNAHLGRHVLTAEGIGANTAFRDVTATVTVVGVSTTRPPPSGGPSGGSTGGTGDDGRHRRYRWRHGQRHGQRHRQRHRHGYRQRRRHRQRNRRRSRHRWHGTGNGNGTDGDGQPTPPPGSVGNGGTAPERQPTGRGSRRPADTDLGNNGGIGNLALYGGLLGLLVLLLILYLLWRDKRDREERELPGLPA